MDGYNINRYYEILQSNELEKAREYKNNYIPKTIYKYFPLFDENYFDYEIKNTCRLETLKNSNIWLSRFDKLNDPFEAKYLIIYKERLKQAGYPDEGIEPLENILEMMRRIHVITCFATTIHNMPLWAHYTNNHKGYCVEFTVKNPDLINKVFYEDCKYNIQFSLQ